MKSKISLLLFLNLLFMQLPSCGPTASRDEIQGVSKEDADVIRKSTESLGLQPGMKIRIAQKALNPTDPTASLSQAGSLEVTVLSSGGSEGLSFGWTLQKSSDRRQAVSDNPLAEGTNENPMATNRMTLANVPEAKAMTLPIFWPEGELYLSNSSAIWLSDRAFEALRQQGKAEWNLGIVGDSLLGSLEEIKFFEGNLKAYNQKLQSNEKTYAEALTVRAEDKLVPFTLKINGTPKRVEARVAGNKLAELTILNNPHNPLILEVKLLPQASRGELLTCPLTPLKSFLEYRVEEILLPK